MTGPKRTEGKIRYSELAMYKLKMKRIWKISK